MNYCIENLIKNLPQREKPMKIDVVLEGGAFNGGYQYGIMLFINELTKKNYISINRVSGCSVGSIVAALFMVNKLHLFDDYYGILRKNLKRKFNLKKLKGIVEEIFKDVTDAEFNKIKNNKLFISYYNVEKKQHIVKSRFNDKQDLIGALLKSAHLPFIINGDGLYEGKYVDGFFPHIFPSRETNHDDKILYLTINRFSQLYRIFNIKSELTSNARALEGIIDIYKLLLYRKETKICSFIQEWSLLDYTKIRMKQLFVVIFIYIYNYGLKLLSVVIPILKKIELFHYIKPIMNEYYKDILLFIFF